MPEMVEQVARALCKCQSEKQFWQDFEIPARAAIEAMREPTDEMMVEAETVAPQLATFAEKEQSPSYRVWRAMIDEALS